MHWYFDVMKNHFADFKGRASRQEYWMFSLIHFILLVILIILGSASNSDFWGALIVIYYLITIVPSLAITVRRLHDIGKSGWMFLVSFVPFVGGIILLIFACLDSEPHDNQYGPNPKHQALDTVSPTPTQPQSPTPSSSLENNEMFCSHCGEKTPVGNFCVKCGKELQV